MEPCQKTVAGIWHKATHAVELPTVAKLSPFALLYGACSFSLVRYFGQVTSLRFNVVQFRSSWFKFQNPTLDLVILVRVQAPEPTRLPFPCAGP